MNMKTDKIVLIAFTIMVIISCSKQQSTSELPVITDPMVSDISNLTNTTASLNVTITSEGASAITAKGVCWSTSHNPTIADSKTSNRHSLGSSSPNKTNDITANLTFTATLTGLSPHTTYYARVYATNSFGTSYSNEITFITTGAVTVTDIDGNVYNTVTIGAQVWMAENLKTTRYNDGTAIPTGLNDAAWQATTTGAYAIYDNNAANNTTYGKLYNWYAVNTGKLAPAGWHVPTDAEWTTLTTYLGGETVAGDKMKAATLWEPYTGITNTNSSGFTGLPAGMRLNNGVFTSVGGYGFFWSSTENSLSSARYRYLAYANSSIHIAASAMGIGSSVRCVKD